MIGQAFHSGAFYVVQTISRVLLAVALGKTLSSEAYGSYSLLVALIGMFTALLPLQAHNYYLREIPGRSSFEGATIFKSLLLPQSVVMAIAVSMLYLIAPLRALVFDLLSFPQARSLPLIVGWLILGESLANEFNRYLYARREIEQGNVGSFLQAGLWPIVVWLVFLRSPETVTLSLVLALWGATQLVTIVYGLWQAKPRELWDARFSSASYFSALSFGAPIVLGSSLLLAGWLGRFLLSRWYSVEAVGVFAYHHGLILMIGGLASTLLGATLQPYIIEAYNSGRPDRSALLLSSELRYRVMLVVPLLLVAAVWEEDLIAFLARRDYAAGRHLFGWLAPIPILLALGSAFEQILFLQRRTFLIGQCYCVAAVVQTAAYFALLPIDPYVGSAVAADLGCAALVAALWWNARGAEVPLNAGLARVGAAAVPCAVLAWLVAGVAPTMTPFVTLALATIVICSAYVACAALFGAFDHHALEEVRRLVGSGTRRLQGLVGSAPEQ